ncbi:hypothetical protein C8J57DRAFT_1240628 [Mycena rebaudengoi]|nr:hypothetical protein C8J57DRAFT_1240628 [Mycena rebaudengoi]
MHRNRANARNAMRAAASGRMMRAQCPEPHKCAPRCAHAAVVRVQCADTAQMRAAQHARSCSRRKRANAHRATRAQLQAGAACARRRNCENARRVVRAQPQVGTACTRRRNRENARRVARAQPQEDAACTRRRNREKARPAARVQPIKHGRGKGNGGGGTFDGLMGRPGFNNRWSRSCIGILLYSRNAQYGYPTNNALGPWYDAGL